MSTGKSYDVVVVGSGVGGSIVAAHLAEKGINPRTGQRLRVAMLEAGPYWKGSPRPGYGTALRRRMITNFISDSPPNLWPWGMMKIVGGTALHAGASVYPPYDVDYQHWVEEGTDWTAENCQRAEAEVRRMYNIHAEPDELLSRGNLLFRETVRKMGREVHQALVGRKNCLYTGFCEGGYFCRYDSRMTPLTNYIPQAENYGLEVIPEATVERLIIEKRGTRKVVSGLVFRNKGRAVQLRAAKIVISAGVVGTPLLLYRSGYGAREDLGSKLIVENNNIGKHLDIHAAVVVSGYFDEPIKDGARGPAPAGFFLLDDAGPSAYGRLRIKDSGMNGIEEPWMLAQSPQAPAFGREHKEFMKKARMHRGGILVVLMKPEGYRGRINLRTVKMEYEGNRIIEQRLRQGGELAREILEKMGAKKIAGYDMPPIYHIAHGVSTCKAGKDPRVSVVNEKFESHDIENLFICDASVLPRSASGDAIGPIATVAGLAAERIVANHFS